MPFSPRDNHRIQPSHLRILLLWFRSVRYDLVPVEGDGTLAQPMARACVVEVSGGSYE